MMDLIAARQQLLDHQHDMTAELMACRQRSQQNLADLERTDELMLDDENWLREQIPKEQDPRRLRKLEAAFVEVLRRRAAVAQGCELARINLEHMPLMPPPKGAGDHDAGPAAGTEHGAGPDAGEVPSIWRTTPG